MKIIRALVALLLSAGLYAAEFEGVAPLGKDMAAARAAAIQDALENASLNRGASVNASSLVAADKPLAEAQTVRGAGVGEYKVLREWQTGLFYHVALDVQPPSPVKKTEAKAAETLQCAGADYRRKVLATPVWVLNPSQINDMGRFPQEFQAELARRMQAAALFLPQISHHEAPFEMRAGNPEPLFQPTQVRALARRHGVQFVTGAVLRDASFAGENYWPAIGQKVRPAERKQVLSLPILDFLGLGIKAVPAFRYFEMDLFVFDGVSGALINRHRLAGVAEGSVAQDPDAVGTARFYETDYGQLVDLQLQAALTRVENDIRCIPFSARIVRVDGGRVYIDAGSSSKIAPGDRLQVYRLRPGQPVDSLGGNESMRLGWAEEVTGSLTVNEVQPLFAVASPQAGLRLEVGDYVRFVGRGVRQ